MVTKPLDFKGNHNPTWCLGCGNYGILNVLRASMSDAGLSPERTVIVSGIGCSGKVPHFINAYGFEVLHGRTLPVATGIRLANSTLKVIACSGDGDGYGIGGNHFLHAIRRNIGITWIVHNNGVYGLTTGQTSPTSEEGFRSKTTPFGSIEEPVNPLALAIAGGAGFVSRAFVGESLHFRKVLTEALNYPGFALVDVLQPCVTFNKSHSYAWYAERVYKVESTEGYDPFDRSKAFAFAFELEKLPLGILYRRSIPSYEEKIPQIAENPLFSRDISSIDISNTLKEFL
ncbi:MAG: 2-oxoacid:ferredoxin oxidoreductase subunit beta [Candidatus Ratteibacteria bacterium]|jgi:2-oxoglutarate ferredoxin oxidoreductase subunit beta